MPPHRALRTNPVREYALRQAEQHTARRHAWPEIGQQILLSRLELLAQAPRLESSGTAPLRVYAA